MCLIDEGFDMGKGWSTGAEKESGMKDKGPQAWC